jgi:hypothetical protein
MPYRPPFDPAEVARATQVAYDERHRYDVQLDRRDRFVPRPLLLCPTCGKDMAARADCATCGDETEVEAA